MKAGMARALVVGVLAAGLASGSPQSRPPDKYETFLKEEVVYIITKTERQVFTKLETDRDRDLFIEEFWKQREPTPGTPRNEFKEEHFRRIEFANQAFGRGAPFRGWRTERGRIYIALGPPFDVQHILSSDAYPMEIWYYAGNPAYGHPSTFRLLFYQKGGGGDYALYNPAGDSPKDLVGNPRRTPNNGTYPMEWDDWDVGAYNVLRDLVSMEAAESSVSLIPGISGFQNRLQSSMLLAEVQNYPQRKINDAYALDILNHKPSVEVSYSVRFMGNQNAMGLLQDPSGRFFLNYIVVPERLSLETYQDKHLAELRTTLRLASPEGRTVYQQERSIPLELSGEEMKAVEKSAFHLYDSVPLIPGMYTVSLLLENTVSKEFTTVEKTVSVPEGNPLWMSPLVLARQVVRDTSAGGASRSFQVGRLQIYPALNNTFRKQDRLFIFLQVYGLSPALKTGGALGYYLFKDDEIIYSDRRSVSEYEGDRDFLEEMTSDKVVPGTYVAKAVLWDANGREVVSQEAPFLVAETSFPNTWVVAQTNPPADDPYYSYVFGTQYLNVGKIDKARAELAAAFEKRPESLEYAVGFGRALLLSKEPEKARDILLRFGQNEAARFDLCEVLGKAYKDTGEFKAAIGWLEKALPLKGNLVEILNPLGECYLNTGDKERALKVWTRSLEINPNQPEIKSLVDKIKGTGTFGTGTIGTGPSLPQI